MVMIADILRTSKAIIGMRGEIDDQFTFRIHQAAQAMRWTEKTVIDR
jgi:hypothetical protein